jgi:hypothetical protein
LALAAQALAARGVKADACKFYQQGLRIALKLEDGVGAAPGNYTAETFRQRLQTCAARAPATAKVR